MGADDCVVTDLNAGMRLLRMMMGWPMGNRNLLGDVPMTSNDLRICWVVLVMWRHPLFGL